MRTLQVQIQTRISEEMKVALDAACKARRVSQGAIIDESLARLFSPDPQEETKLDVILQLLRGLLGQMQELEERKQAGAERAATSQATPQGADLMAFYAAIQGAVPPPAPPGTSTEAENMHRPSSLPQQSWWRRLLLKGPAHGTIHRHCPDSD